MRHHLDPDEWTNERGEIFALYQVLGVREESERHRLQHALTGCSSLRLMTSEEHRKLIGALHQIAEQPAAKQTYILNGLLALSGFDYHDADQHS